MPVPFQVTLDCWNVHMMAAWWADRLGYSIEDDHATVRALVDEGRVAADDIVTMNGRLAFSDAAAAYDPAGLGPRLCFTAVKDTKSAKNRVHLDLDRGDRELKDAVDDYVEAGATFTEFASRRDRTWAVLADPEGNEFCIQ